MNDLGKIFLPAKSAITQKTTAVLRLTGEDASSFLQGQISQETRTTLPQPAIYGLFLNHKGKVIADAHALKVSDAEWWLWSEASPADVLAHHLESFVVADDVTIEDRSEDWTVTTLAGASEAAASLSALIGQPLPEAGAYARVGEGFMFRGQRGLGDSWKWLAPAAAQPTLDGWTPPAPMLMERSRIEAGIPRVPVDIGPGDLPHEGGPEFVAASISYTKGCYLGQEIMARLKSGQVRRRLVRVRGEGVVPEALPTTLYRDGRAAGELRSAVAAGSDRSGGFAGLALVTLAGLAGGSTAQVTFSITREGREAVVLIDDVNRQ